jgi:phage terminase small subunit
VPKKAKNAALTDAEERFCDEYIVSLNATTAYQRAYPGASYTSARARGSELRAKLSIKAAIEGRQKALRKRNNCEADRVVQELVRLAFSDIEDVVDLTLPANPCLRNRDEIPPDARRAIQEISRTQFGVKVKLASKDAALDKLMRHLGLYRDLPPLEVLFNALEPADAAAFRAFLAATVHGGGATEAAPPALKLSPDSGQTPDGPGARDDGGGADAGRLAGGTHRLPGAADRGALHAAQREDADGGGAGDGPLLDEE